MAARDRPQARDPASGKFLGSWRERDRTITRLDLAVPDPTDDFTPLSEIVSRPTALKRLTAWVARITTLIDYWETRNARREARDSDTASALGGREVGARMEPEPEAGAGADVLQGPSSAEGGRAQT